MSESSRHEKATMRAARDLLREAEIGSSPELTRSNLELGRGEVQSSGPETVGRLELNTCRCPGKTLEKGRIVTAHDEHCEVVRPKDVSVSKGKPAEPDEPLCRCVKSGVPCAKCHDRYSPKSLYMRSPRFAQPTTERAPFETRPRGWECPKCGAVMAPTKDACVNCTGTTITHESFGITTNPLRDKQALARFYKDDPEAPGADEFLDRGACGAR